MNSPIADNYQHTLKAIEQTCQHNQRAAENVLLLSVSKTHPFESVAAAYAAGARDFGENYVQEAVDKIEALDALMPDNQAIWHFIGPLQSNKTRLVAEYFDWVHSVERLKIAQRLSEQRPVSRLPLNVCLQVNISQQDSKSGCAPNEASTLALSIAQLPHLRLRGLMTIPAPTNPADSVEQQRAPFDALRVLFERIKTQLPPEQAEFFDTLSMGMSDDYELAIAAGSTIVRVGTAIFGARHYPNELETQ